jgi:hypothetical protein
VADKKQRDYVNPKWLLREIMKSLPAEQYVRSTVAALWTFSNDYIQKDDIANGTVSFSGSVSYSQLAEVLATGESTAKWRINQLREKYELVEWERTKFGIKFTFGNYLSADAERRSVQVTESLSALVFPETTSTDELDIESPRTQPTPAQKACERSTSHSWFDYLHTTQQCSACGFFRINPKILEWTEADDREAEYMAWLEEEAPDNWNPFESLWAADPTQPTSPVCLEQPYGDSRQKASQLTKCSVS